MIEFVALTCPSCGGKLEIAKDIEQFACGYCNAEYIVRRDGSIVSLSPLAENLRKIQSGTDKTASELAIKRLQKEIYNLEHEITRTKNTRLLKLKAVLQFAEEEYKKGKSGFRAFFTILVRDFTEPASFELQDLSIEWLEELLHNHLDDFGVSNREGEKRKLEFKAAVEEIRRLEDELTEKRAQLDRHKQIVRT